MSCTVYVKIPDAVYYITANTGATLAVDGILDDGAPIKQVTKSNVAGHAKIRQLWKIRYVGNGCYGIRSLYKSDRAMSSDVGGTARLDVVGTADTVAAFPDNALWKIEQVGSGYVLQNCGFTTGKRCLRPSGSIGIVITYEPGNNAFVWTLTPDTAVPDLMILIDADTCFPVNGSVKSVSLGESATLEDLNLIVSYISQYGNTTNYYWQVNDSGIASITGSNNKVSALARGETTISLHASSSTNTPMYFTLHVPWVDDGTYYIRNWETDRYIEAETAGYVHGKSFYPGSTQLWDITYVGNREYTIHSNQISNCYLGINGDASTEGALVMTKSANLTAGTKWTFTKMDSGAFRISAQCAPDLYIRTLASESPYIRQYAPEDSGSQYSEWLFCEYSDQVAHEMQTEENWCWVTCARMASFKYMKSPISQVSASYYAKVYDHFEQYNLPHTLYPILGDTNLVLGDGSAELTARALEYILGWEGCTYYGEYIVYSETVLRSLLDAGNVIIAGRLPAKGVGHAYVVYGYSYNSTLGRYQYHMYDPGYGDEGASITRTYAWLYNGDYAYYSDHRDGRVWMWLVTYRIGDYTNTMPKG